MSQSKNRFGFHTSFPARPDKLDAWWTSDVVNDVILAPVREAGDLANATHFARDEQEPIAITSPDQLAREASTWRDAVVAIFAGPQNAPTWRLHLRLEHIGPSIGFRISEDPDGKIRERFAGWLGQWCRGLAKLGCDLDIGYMAPVQRPYPRPRPPRDGTAWPLGKLELYLGRRWHGEDEERKTVLARIMDAPLVPGVRRVIEDDLVRVSFECDLSDDVAVERARIIGERWLTPLVPTTTEPGWNEEGDEMIVPSMPVNREPFTFFDEDDNIGYWALIRDPEDGSVDEERWQQLADIARAKKLSDGTNVTAVRLIAPVRKEALALADRAAADGFDMVTYPAGNGAFWRVFSGSSERN